MAKRYLPLASNCPPPPSPADVLYVTPVPDARGRTCSNCVLYSGRNRCSIHGPTVHVTPSMVCGYHVFGAPSAPVFEDIDYVLPELSGLVDAPPSGTRCGNCMYIEYDDERRADICMAVAQEAVPGQSWLPAKVDEFGCCSRWTHR